MRIVRKPLPTHIIDGSVDDLCTPYTLTSVAFVRYKFDAKFLCHALELYHLQRLVTWLAQRSYTFLAGKNPNTRPKS